jgi:hypothetical protein
MLFEWVRNNSLIRDATSNTAGGFFAPAAEMQILVEHILPDSVNPGCERTNLFPK